MSKYTRNISNIGNHKKKQQKILEKQRRTRDRVKGHIAKGSNEKNKSESKSIKSESKSVKAAREANSNSSKTLLSELSAIKNNFEKLDLYKATMRTLWSCNSIAEVDELFQEWADMFQEKACHTVGYRKIDPEMASTVKALIQKPGALSRPTLISRFVCQNAYEALHDRLLRIATDQPEIEMALVTIISGDGETSHFNTEIELFESQRCVQRTMRAISRDFLGITELALFNSEGHPSGGKRVQRHEHALVWGEGVIAKGRLIADKHAGRYKANFTKARVIDVRPVKTDPVNLRRMSAYLMKPPFKCMNWNPPKNGKRGHMNHSEKGDRPIRYLRLAQIRSMISFDTATFAGGDGIRIRREIIEYLRSAVKNRAESEKPILHPDAVGSFWVTLMQALRLPWNLPIIRTSQ